MKSKRQVPCLICEKLLNIDKTGLSEGGSCTVSFGWASHHDQMGAIAGISKLDDLLMCNRIVCYICDDCFEKKHHLFEGYKIIRKERRVRIV